MEAEPMEDPEASLMPDSTEEESDSGRSRESMVVLKLQNEVRRIRSSREKTSSHREKKGAHRKELKNLHPNENLGNRIPVSLGRGSLRCTIIQIGQVNANPAFGDEEFWYPVGFMSRRRYMDFDESGSDSSKATFNCTIVSIDDRPQVALSSFCFICCFSSK